MYVREFILHHRARLAQAGLECADPLLHMKQLVEAGLGIDSTRLYLRWESELTPEELAKLEPMVERRLTGEPFQYIVGYEDFWKDRFRVGPGCLIPRRETEVLVERLLAVAPASACRIAELGPGSGCIGISALREQPEWEWFAYELNPQSLTYLRTNRDALLPPNAAFHIVPGDFFELARKNAPFDWLVSNPPYVASGELPALSREVRHEPSLALDGGASGLETLEKLALEAKRLLKPRGSVLFEIGSDQGTSARVVFEAAGLLDVSVIKDYAGLPRVIQARIP